LRRIGRADLSIQHGQSVRLQDG